jgi:hypothetical protein
MLTVQEGPRSMDLAPDLIVDKENSFFDTLIHKIIRVKLYEQIKFQLRCWSSIYNQEMDNKLR